MALISGDVHSVDDVSAISPQKTEWTINVKVIRLWISYTLQPPTAVNSVEMVLMDSKGVKIHATVHQSLLFKFQHLLSENRVYNISTFDVVQNEGPFKTTSHGFKIRFNMSTQVARITDNPITISPFAFVPFSKILSKQHDPDYFVDIIGMLTAVGSVLEWDKDSIKKKRIQIELESDSLKMECVLLGGYVDELTNFVSKGHVANSVVVLQLAKMRTLNGVQTIVGPTKLYFNPDIDEAAHVEQRFLETSDGPIKVLKQLEDPTKKNIREDFMSLASIKTIEEIGYMNENSICVTLAKIKFFAPPCDWWFPSVKSKKCGSCRGRVNSIIPKYHIPVRVADKSGMATFIICDDEATRLFDKSCADLIENHYEGLRNTGMPAELCSLIGRTFLFKIMVNTAATKNFEPSYHVRKLCWDSDIINEFKIMYPKLAYIDGITEASLLGSGNQLRRLFTYLLSTSTMSKPEVVWEKTWKLLSDGIGFQRRRELKIPDLHISDKDLMNLCLLEIEKLLQSNGRSLKEFTCLPYPDHCDGLQFQNKLVADELNYNREDMIKARNTLLQSLTIEQKSVYEEIINSVMADTGGFYFLYGFGGSGKTYVWNTLSAALRSEGLIVLNVASSGIASLLLPGGRTAHSRFSIPININEDSTCHVKQGSHKAELIQRARLIIWDEAPMLNKHCFEALDRTFNDIMKTKQQFGYEKPFGGKVVVLGGDFRQILPVVTKGSRADIVGSAINSSHLWKHCKVRRLTKNMRLSDASSSICETREFAEWILKVGDGKVNQIEGSECDIVIPPELLIQETENPLQSLVDFAYPDMLHNMKKGSFFQDRAILAPTLDSVDEINNYMLNMFRGDEKEYLSHDSTLKSDENDDIHGEWFTTEFLNDVKLSGLPNHKLILKVGVPIMLLRNIDQAAGLCNGTRIIVSDLSKNVIGALFASGPKRGQKVFIARMDLIPSESGLPFKFQRRQFPVALCFAMTINKSQGQSLSYVGLYLPKPVFTHGQLYVAISRVKSKNGLKILILDSDGVVCSSTKNVVYEEIFDNV